VSKKFSRFTHDTPVLEVFYLLSYGFVCRVSFGSKAPCLAGARCHTDALPDLLRKELVGLAASGRVVTQAKLAKRWQFRASYALRNTSIGERRLDAIELCIILRFNLPDPSCFYKRLFEVSPAKL